MAVLAAILVVVALILAAFVVDLGMAWAAKRQLSVAADAAALAAASAVGERLSEVSATSCTPSQLDAVGAQTIAQNRAEEIHRANDAWRDDPSRRATLGTVTVTCADGNTSSDKQVQVTVTNSRTLQAFFDGLTQVGQLVPAQSATARYVRVPPVLRPWAVCDSTALTAQAFPFMTFAIGIDQDVVGCGGLVGGPWGGVDFDRSDDAEDRAELVQSTETGYGDPVPLPDPALPATVLDPLTPDPGLSGPLEAMVGKVVTFPVVAGCTAPCTDPGATFAAEKAVTVQICGVRYNGVDYAQGSSCWVTPSSLLPPVATANHIQFRWVPHVNASYDRADSDTCAFSDAQCVGAIQLYEP